MSDPAKNTPGQTPAGGLKGVTCRLGAFSRQQSSNARSVEHVHVTHVRSHGPPSPFKQRTIYPVVNQQP